MSTEKKAFIPFPPHKYNLSKMLLKFWTDPISENEHRFVLTSQRVAAQQQ